MSTVFVGGSRQISRLSPLVRERLDNILRSGHVVVVGDANGGDKAVQRYLAEAAYKAVTVYCSGAACRNNVGSWPAHFVKAPKSAKGFAFYAVKDREMAAQADFGLMIWDGKSAGTVLNVLRLVRSAKKAVLIDVSQERALNFKSEGDWNAFVAQCGEAFITQLKERATDAEWKGEGLQESLFDQKHQRDVAPSAQEGVVIDQLAADINAALAEGNTARVVTTLGDIAKARGMSQVAKDAGLARESLYRSLSVDGNPEFATVLKVIESVGLKLSVTRSGA
mgnify:CR=1 FL=1